MVKRLIMMLIVLLLPAAARAQLSPGDLATAHADLEGVTNCTTCHKLGKKGTTDQFCLACHTEIADGLEHRRGYHHLATRPSGKTCGQCHSDHNGREFAMIHWPDGRERIDHANQAGYALEGGHRGLACEKCHRPEKIKRDPRQFRAEIDLKRTYLGLDTACLDCHEDEHRGQLDRDCTKCHDMATWKPVARYDHQRGNYPLVGKHRGLECLKCHGRIGGEAGYIRFTGLEYRNCTPCHQDTHRGQLGADCARCHNTDGWLRVTDGTFDHDRTVYPLEGRHREARCRKCHTGPKMTTPLPHAACTDCHEDRHCGQLTRREDQGRCESCHDVSGFLPARYDLAEHQKSRYPLDGAHLALPCFECHRQEPGPTGEPCTVYRIPDTACHDCHRDEHRGQFPRETGQPWCDRCHNTFTWQSLEFDHGRTRFPLTLSHTRVACDKCHTVAGAGTPEEHVLYRPLELTCKGCHEDPHLGQFASGEPLRDCEACHTAESWKNLTFDHNSDSRFVLRGAHEKVACARCHIPENSPIRYRPLESSCISCHGNQPELLKPSTLTR